MTKQSSLDNASVIEGVILQSPSKSTAIETSIIPKINLALQQTLCVRIPFASIRNYNMRANRIKICVKYTLKRLKSQSLRK